MIMASSPQFDVAMTAIILSMTVAVVWIIADQWRRIRVAAYNARLKQLMIERGMSADEIERVLRAGGDTGRGKRSQRSVAIGMGQGFGTDCCADDLGPKKARS